MSADLLALLDRLETVHAAATEGPWEQNETWTRWIDTENSLIAEAQSPADASAIVAEHNAIPGLVAAVRAALVMHTPRQNAAGLPPACPDCLGGIYADDPTEARSCGCWGLSEPVCVSCADYAAGRRYPMQWPCPTARALASALPDLRSAWNEAPDITRDWYLAVARAAISADPGPDTADQLRQRVHDLADEYEAISRRRDLADSHRITCRTFADRLRAVAGPRRDEETTA